MSEATTSTPSPEVSAKPARASTDMVGKALRLLVILGDFPSGASISELSKEAGYPLSSTHRLLRSLSQAGFVTNDRDSRRYHVGLRVFELGHRVSQERGFGGMALPVMSDVVAVTGEACLLGVRVGAEQLFVHSVPSPRPVQIKAQPGTRGPLHCTAMGKVLVAFSPDAVREELVRTLPLERYTPYTVVDRPTFAEDIARVRAQGYATSLEEHDVGVNSIAVPVIDAGGELLAAVACAAPASRVDRNLLLTFRDALGEAAAKLAVLLPRA